MGTKGKEIVGMDVKKIIELLNKLFADEWLAYYQYWIGAKVVKGKMKEVVVAELNEHASDELRHAEMLAGRIIQLGGLPITKPQDWYKMSNCGYSAPDNPAVKAILQQNVEGEQCAIEGYKRLLETVKDKDVITYELAVQILKDEVEHEEDLQAILEDIEG